MNPNERGNEPTQQFPALSTSPVRRLNQPMPRTNWAGNVILGAARVHRPESVDSLRRIVDNSSRIRALGRGHSFSGIVGVAGDLVLLDGLPKMLDIDSARSTVKVAAGMSYAEVAWELHRSGFALANMASIPHISIAGACATGTHGSGDINAFWPPRSPQCSSSVRMAT